VIALCLILFIQLPPLLPPLQKSPELIANGYMLLARAGFLIASRDLSSVCSAAFDAAVKGRDSTKVIGHCLTSMHCVCGGRLCG
jgi:hypothetical protein